MALTKAILTDTLTDSIGFNKRTGRNPKTGEEKVISARRVVTFKVSPTLDARVEVHYTPASSAS